MAAFALAGALGPNLHTRLSGLDCRQMEKVERAPAPPDTQHLLGTDDQGRDLLAAILCGSRTSLTVGVMAELIALAVGVLLGGAAGFTGGRMDAALMRLTDVALALPFPLVAIAVVALSRSTGLLSLVLLLGLLGWPAIARLVRARLLTLRETSFVHAARASGAGSLRVLLCHALPAAMAPAWAVAAAGVGSNVLAEAWLSFIGLGDPARHSWGALLDSARSFAPQAWWYALFPGLAITLSVLGFLLLGDALQHRLDPRSASENP